MSNSKSFDHHHLEPITFKKNEEKKTTQPSQTSNQPTDHPCISKVKKLRRLTPPRPQPRIQHHIPLQKAPRVAVFHWGPWKTNHPNVFLAKGYKERKTYTTETSGWFCIKSKWTKIIKNHYAVKTLPVEETGSTNIYEKDWQGSHWFIPLVSDLIFSA